MQNEITVTEKVARQLCVVVFVLVPVEKNMSMLSTVTTGTTAGIMFPELC